MTKNSLVIIDELGRSTAVEEGTALAMAICEELARSKAYVFVTTHFTLLTKLADICLNIKTWQMDTTPLGYSDNLNDFRLKFKFSLIPGVTTLKGYGIYMVRNGFPRGTRMYAQKLLAQLPEREEASANEQLVYENNQKSMENVTSDIHLHNELSPKQHIFPNVRIIQGLNLPSMSVSLSPLSDIWCIKKTSNDVRDGLNIEELATNSKDVNEQENFSSESLSSSLDDESLRFFESSITDVTEQSISDASI